MIKTIFHNHSRCAKKYDWKKKCLDHLVNFHPLFLLFIRYGLLKLTCQPSHAIKGSRISKNVSLLKLRETIKSDDKLPGRVYLYAVVTVVKSGWCRAGRWYLGWTECLWWLDILRLFSMWMAAAHVVTITLILMSSSSTPMAEFMVSRSVNMREGGCLIWKKFGICKALPLPPWPFYISVCLTQCRGIWTFVEFMDSPITFDICFRASDFVSSMLLNNLVQLSRLPWKTILIFCSFVRMGSNQHLFDGVLYISRLRPNPILLRSGLCFWKKWYKT